MDGFRILSKIGEGSYSTVLKVQRVEDGNIYALKRVKFYKLSDKEKMDLAKGASEKLTATVRIQAE